MHATCAIMAIYTWLLETEDKWNKNNLSCRAVGLGLCSVAARIGGILSPIILLLGDYFEILPFLLFGSSAVLAGLLALLLPETQGQKTTTDAERRSRVRKVSAKLIFKSWLGCEQINYLVFKRNWNVSRMISTFQALWLESESYRLRCKILQHKIDNLSFVHFRCQCMRSGSDDQSIVDLEEIDTKDGDLAMTNPAFDATEEKSE